MATLSGILPVLAMPYADDESIDEDVLAREVAFLLGAGVDGIAFGFASDIARLTDVERDRAVRVASDSVAGRVPLIASIQAGSTAALLRRAEASAMAGATMFMVTPPGGGIFAPDDLVAHFGALSDRLGLPIIVQDAPAITGTHTPVAVLARIAIKVEGVVAVKAEAAPTAPKIRTLADAIGGHAAVLGGAGGFDFYNELERGASGTIPGAALPELFVKVFELHRGGQRAESRSLLHRLLPLLSLGLRGHDAYCHTQKEVLRRRGIFPSVRVRTPAELPDEDFVRELTQAIDEIAGLWPELGIGPAG